MKPRGTIQSRITRLNLEYFGKRLTSTKRTILNRLETAMVNQ